MQLSLTLPERIGLIIVLDECSIGDRNFLSLVKHAKAEVDIKEEEIKEYSITARPGGGLDWAKKTQDVTKNFLLSDGVLDIVRKRLEEKEKLGRLHMDLLPILEKIAPAQPVQA